MLGSSRFKNVFSRNFIATILAIFLTASVGVAAEMDALVGNWTLSIEMPNGPRLVDLSIKKKEDGSGLTGSAKSQMGDVAIEEVKIENDSYVLSYTMKRENQPPMALKMNLKLKGDELAGSLQFGQGNMGAEVKGAKAGTESEKALKEAVAQALAKSQGIPTLPIADAGGFVGEWTLTIESQVNGTQDVEFVIKDVGGKASAELKMPPPLGEHVINTIVKSEKGLDLKYEVKFGGQSLNVTLALELKDGKLSGTMSDENGLFEIPVKGVKKGEASGESAQEVARNEGGAQRRTLQQTQATAHLLLGGKNIIVSYGRPTTKDAGNSRIPMSAEPGFIWRLGKEFATKIKTETDLVFGDKVIKAGRYGLWAKKTADGWNLLINEKPDVWGTQHDPSADVAEIPLTRGKTDADVEQMTIELKEENGAANFIIRWGGDELRTNFKTAGPAA